MINLLDPPVTCLSDLLVVALPLHLLLDPAHPARPQLLEVVHRPLHPLHHREVLPDRQLHEPEGQVLGHHGGHPSLKGMEIAIFARLGCF